MKLLVKWNVRLVMLLVFIAVLSCLIFFGVFALQGLKEIRNASLTYQRLIAQPREASSKVSVLLEEVLVDLYQLKTKDFENPQADSRIFKKGMVWERTYYQENKAEWAEAHMKIPYYREAALYEIKGDSCTLANLIRNPESEKEYRYQSNKERLFPFDSPCDFLLKHPDGTFISDQMSWYSPSKRQVSSFEEDPVDSRDLKPHGDGIYRFGRRLKSKDRDFIVLLALDIRHLVDRVIHILPYPAEEIVFPSYLRSDYTILADRMGDFIAGPKPWRMPGYDYRTRKPVAFFTEGKDRDQPLRYPEFSVYPPKIPDLLFLEGNSEGVTLNTFYGKLNKQVKTAIHYPVYLSLPNGQPRYFFGTVSIGMRSIDFAARSTSFDRIVKEKIHEETLALSLAFLLSAFILVILFWYWWKRFSTPLMYISDEVSKIRTADDSIVNLSKLSGDLHEFQTLARDINDLLKRMREQSRKLLTRSLAERSMTTAAQVFHDIQSPVMALDSIASRSAELPEDIRGILQQCIQRIRALSSNLRQRAQEEEMHPEVIPVESVLEEVLQEKRLEYVARQHVHLELELPLDSFGMFTRFPTEELKRVLSNLINNAYEAFRKQGEVQIKLALENDEIVISVHDNGPGISQHVLSRIGEKGFSFGKEKGSGLGVFHAQQIMRKHEGSLVIESELGQGTTVTLTLPRAQTPSWFCQRVSLLPNVPVVIVDDDPAVHSLWKRRLPTAQVISFMTLEKFKLWMLTKEQTPFTLICDYEFPDTKETGLELIENFALSKFSLLSTFRYLDTHVQDEATRLGIALLPKSLLQIVPIQKQESQKILVSGVNGTGPF